MNKKLLNEMKQMKGFKDYALWRKDAEGKVSDKFSADSHERHKKPAVSKKVLV